MKLYFHPEADKELIKLEEERQKAVNRKIEEFKKQGMEYRYFGRLTNEAVGLDCYRLKIRQKNPVEVNQRIIIDRFENQFVALGVKSRDEVYSEEYLEKIMDRKY